MTPAEFAAARTTLGYSQRGIAKKLGVGSATITRWESGTTRIPAAIELALTTLRRNAMAPASPDSLPDGDLYVMTYGRRSANRYDTTYTLVVRCDRCEALNQIPVTERDDGTALNRILCPYCHRTGWPTRSTRLRHPSAGQLVHPLYASDGSIVEAGVNPTW